jgi:5-oxopent-3-ene-1,2,5-tricarboxylate decarboxylase/2-hydroxyhepta-2,4-diene-1,7-dioate isomerase
MRLIQFLFDGKLRWGQFVESDHTCLDFSRASGVGDLRGYLSSRNAPSLAALRKECLARNYVLPVKNRRLMPPIFPDTLFGVGLNHKSLWKGRKTPTIFLKAIQTIIGHKSRVRIPQFVNDIYAEVELAVVIGRRRSIFGYTIANDVSVPAKSMKARQDIWFYSKSIDSFTPLGPWIVTRDEIPDHGKVNMFLEINGKVEIEANTSERIFSPEQVISAITRNITLRPGDVIMMGCPGPAGKIKDGDVMRLGLQGIGVLENRIVRE